MTVCCACVSGMCWTVYLPLLKNLLKSRLHTESEKLMECCPAMFLAYSDTPVTHTQIYSHIYTTNQAVLSTDKSWRPLACVVRLRILLLVAEGRTFSLKRKELSNKNVLISFPQENLTNLSGQFSRWTAKDSNRNYGLKQEYPWNLQYWCSYCESALWFILQSTLTATRPNLLHVIFVNI